MILRPSRITKIQLRELGLYRNAAGSVQFVATSLCERAATKIRKSLKWNVAKGEAIFPSCANLVWIKFCNPTISVQYVLANYGGYEQQ